MNYIMALDLGTSSLKVMLLNEKADISFLKSVPYPTKKMQAGYSEQEPTCWIKAMKQAITAALCVAPKESIAAVSFSGHMSTLLLLDEDKNPLHDCITLADGRSTKQCEELNSLLGDALLKNSGNCAINAFSMPKLLWMKENHPDILAKTAFFVSAKDYLRYHLTGTLDTEYTDAYNSLLINWETLSWNEEIISTLGFPRYIFPDVLKPYDVAGYVTSQAAAEFGLLEGTPVAAGAADMACAAVGMNLWETGSCALTIGTSATFLCAVEHPSQIGKNQITYHVHALPGHFYALGSHFNGGLALNWFSSVFSDDGKIDYQRIGTLSEEALQIPNGKSGILSIPFLIGSGSPYFCAEDSAAFLGVSQASSRSALFKALLEGIALNMKQSQTIFEQICGHKLQTVYLGGGGTHVKGWDQIFADVLNCTMTTADTTDASTVGAALLGALSVQMFPDIRQISQSMLKTSHSNVPNALCVSRYQKLYDLYQNLYTTLHSYSSELKNV